MLKTCKILLIYIYIYLYVVYLLFWIICSTQFCKNGKMNGGNLFSRSVLCTIKLVHIFIRYTHRQILCCKIIQQHKHHILQRVVDMTYDTKQPTCKQSFVTKKCIFLNFKHTLKFTLKYTNIAPTCFGLRSSSGSLH